MSLFLDSVVDRIVASQRRQCPNPQSRWYITWCDIRDFIDVIILKIQKGDYPGVVSGWVQHNHKNPSKIDTL